VDSLTWGAAALASISSGVIYQASGYTMISVIGLLLLAGPLFVVLRHRKTPLASHS
jgi:hypothetical protein